MRGWVQRPSVVWVQAWRLSHHLKIVLLLPPSLSWTRSPLLWPPLQLLPRQPSPFEVEWAVSHLCWNQSWRIIVFIFSFNNLKQFEANPYISIRSTLMPTALSRHPVKPERKYKNRFKNTCFPLAHLCFYQGGASWSVVPYQLYRTSLCHLSALTLASYQKINLFSRGHFTSWWLKKQDQIGLERSANWSCSMFCVLCTVGEVSWA